MGRSTGKIRNRNKALILAGQIYGLAMVAHSDAFGAKNEDEEIMMGNAAKNATRDLELMGFDVGQLCTPTDCLEQVLIKMDT